MEFLTSNTRSLLEQKWNGNFISAKGKDVIVIGGGDTGTDCVGTALRHGCRSLVQLEILPRPPLERAADNPWPEWPKVYRLDYGQEEAAAKFGADPRVYLTTAKRFVADEHGWVKEVHTVQIQWERNEKGQFVPKEVPGTEQVRPAQLVLLAMGFLGPEQPLLDALGIERDPRTNVKAEFENTAPTSRAFLPPATAAAARAWWSGPSTKAAAPPANATVTSWAARTCLEASRGASLEGPGTECRRSPLDTRHSALDTRPSTPDTRPSTPGRPVAYELS